MVVIHANPLLPPNRLQLANDVPNCGVHYRVSPNVDPMPDTSLIKRGNEQNLNKKLAGVIIHIRAWCVCASVTLG